MKCAAFCALFGEKYAVIGEDCHGIAPDAGKSGHEAGAVKGFEFMKFRTIDETGDHLPDLIGGSDIRRDDAVELGGVETRRYRGGDIDIQAFDGVQPGDDIPHDGDGMFVIGGDMVYHAGYAAMGIGTAEFGCGDDLARGGFDERRTGQENRPLAFRAGAAHDYGLVAHGRHIGAARGREAHDAGDLRNAARTHIRLIEKDPAEMLFIGKNLGLVRQVGAAAIDQIDTRQIGFECNFLRAQMLLMVRGKYTRRLLTVRVVGDDHDLPAADLANAADQPGARRVVVVKPVGGELAEFQEGRARLEQALDALARQQFAAGDVAGTDRLRAAERGTSRRAVRSCSARPRFYCFVAAKIFARRIDGAAEMRHAIYPG